MLVIFGMWFSYKLYQSEQSTFIFDGLVFMFIGIIGFTILVWVILKDIKEFEKSKRISSFATTIFGLIFILTIFGQFYYQDNKKNSPSLLRGYYASDFNGFSVDFKTNGKYVMANGSGLGEDYFYGTYVLEDSIITIDKTQIDNCIKTNKLVIRYENYYTKDSIDLLNSKANYITQIDRNGNELNNKFRFRVIEDNRK